MDRKRILGLLLFGCLVIAGLFYGTSILIKYGADIESNQEQSEYVQEDAKADSQENSDVLPDRTMDYASEESWLFENEADNITSDTGVLSDTAETGQEKSGASVYTEYGATGDAGEEIADTSVTEDGIQSGNTGSTGNTEEVISSDSDQVVLSDSSISGQSGGSTEGNIGSIGSGYEGPSEEQPETVEVSGEVDTSLSFGEVSRLNLIYDCNLVDYKTYIPEMVYDSSLEAALDIANPEIEIDARAAILFDANTEKVLYYKNPVAAVFPASTAKLLTALVALDWCKEDDKVTIGNEIRMIASDSTRAYIARGQVLTVRNLLEGMLIPSGNDAAYAIATYVGRKSLQREGALELEAVEEFVRLMNFKAENIGTINSCFKTPDGYDAIGQYTTAYDMGLIGLAAADNSTILKITKMSNARNVFVSGEDITWESTNALIDRYGGHYYSYCIGMKTGTSTMAGRCLISAGKKDGKEVVCVIMDSSAQGRWEDTIKLLDYGLD